MLITMAVSLYTVRIVLNTLGVEDYGLYNVVGGIVALLAFLPGSMATATQRFFSHALGQQDQDKLNRVFGVNTLIYLTIGLLALIILKTGGGWFVANHLSIPDGRFEAVQAIFDIAVITFVVTILKSPFMAIIIAHEDMIIYAYMAILDAFLKLGAVFLLVHLPGEKIVVYAWLLLSVAIIDTLLYLIICFRKYSECRIRHIRWEQQLAKEVVGFTGWTLFGQICMITRGHATTILINQFFNPSVVAARAISSSISGYTSTFASNLNLSLYAPIVKTHAGLRNNEMYDLIYAGGKFTFYLTWILFLPIFFHLEWIVQLWLGKIPEYVIPFTQLLLIQTIIYAVSMPLTTAARAPGKMALYETLMGGIQLLTLPVAWLLLKNNFTAYSIIMVSVIAEGIMFIVRLLMVNRLTGMPIIGFIRKACLPVIAISAISLCGVFGIQTLIVSLEINQIFSLVSSLIITTIVIYYVGLSKEIRSKVVFTIKKKINF